MNQDTSAIIEILNQMQTQSNHNFQAIGEQLTSLYEKVSDNFKAIDILARYGQDRNKQVKTQFKQVEDLLDKMQHFNTNRFNGLDRRMDDLAGSRPRAEIIEEIHHRLERIENKVFSPGSPV